MSSERIATLAERFGASEALVERSAQARAAALGSTADAVLNEWTGGAAAPPVSAPAPAEDAAPAAVEPEPPAHEAPEPVESELEVETAEEALPEEPATDLGPPEQPAIDFEPEPVPAGSLSVLLLSALAVFAIMFVAVVIAPASGENAQSLDAVETIELSSAAVDGRDIYQAEGCAACHTQQVRPIITDGDLGIITLSDSPLIPGAQRIGPDLSHVGSREPTNDAGWLTAYLEDPQDARPGSDHPSFSYLPEDDVNHLVSYLLESK